MVNRQSRSYATQLPTVVHTRTAAPPAPLLQRGLIDAGRWVRPRSLSLCRRADGGVAWLRLGATMDGAAAFVVCVVWCVHHGSEIGKGGASMLPAFSHLMHPRCFSDERRVVGYHPNEDTTTESSECRASIDRSIAKSR